MRNLKLTTGYVTLVRAKKVDGNIVECENRTGMWAWKHYHKDTDTTTYVEMKGEIVFNGVDFGYTDDKIVLHDVKLYANPGRKACFRWLNRCRKNYYYKPY